MASMTIRNVPDDVRDELAARAAVSGKSLQEYVRGELIQLASKPDTVTWVAQVRERKRLMGGTVTSDEIVASIREGRRE